MVILAIRHLLKVVVFLVAGLGPSVQASELPSQLLSQSPASTTERGDEGKRVVGLTAEETLRAFLVAMLTKDAMTLRDLTLPAADLELLLQGEGAPASRLEQLKTQIAKQPIRALKPGDSVALPGNRRITVQPEEVSDDRAVLLPEGAPIPTRCRKVDGKWRVDAGAIIAGIKAADAA